MDDEMTSVRSQKTIGFNFMPYSAGLHGGAEVYLRCIYKAFRARCPEFDTLLIGEPSTLSACAIGVPGEFLLPLRVGKSRLGRSIQEQWALPLHSLRNRLDCLVSNYVVPLAAPCKTVGIVHDMLYRNHPESMERAKRLYWSLMMPASLYRSDAVVAVSAFSAGEIAHYFPSTRAKLFTTVEGVRPSLQAIQGAGRLEAFPWPYLVTPATFGAHKNLKALVGGFAMIAPQFQDLRLVLIGAARTPDAVKYRDEVLSEAHILGCADRIVSTGHVSDEELAALYTHAEACILPSLYEGFGLPVIEAQFFGCPVLCSNRASLPEVAGDAALLFDPTAPDAIGTAIKALISEPGLREDLKVKGFQNVKRYTWDQAAQQLAQAIGFAMNGVD